MSESHSVTFKKKWGSSFGLYGEQGAESYPCTVQCTELYLLQSKTWHTATKVCDERELYKTAPKVKTVPTRKRKIQPEE